MYIPYYLQMRPKGENGKTDYYSKFSTILYFAKASPISLPYSVNAGNTRCEMAADL